MTAAWIAAIFACAWAQRPARGACLGCARQRHAVLAAPARTSGWQLYVPARALNTGDDQRSQRSQRSSAIAGRLEQRSANVKINGLQTVLRVREGSGGLP